MEERLPELLAIAIVALVAISMGLLLVRLKQPPIVGYILAGIMLGPTVLGFVPQVASIPLMAELGVLLLLFVIGMEISLRAFILDLRPAVLTVLGQATGALIVMAVFGWALAWPMAQVLLLAFIITLSSTAVALKTLEDIGELRTDMGRLVVAVMIAQDIAIVPILILLKTTGGDHPLDVVELVVLIGAMIGLGFFIAYLGRPGKLKFPFSRHLTGSVELVTLAGLTICFTSATISGMLGLSPIYGAFVAGLYLGKTNLRSEAIRAMQPIQGVLMVMFFVAIGLLLDMSYITANLGLVTLFVLGVLIFKSLANVLILRAVGMSWMDAYQAGLIMGQIGEFSFVLAGIGIASQVLDQNGYKLAISVIVLSLLLSPLWMSAIRRVHRAAEAGVANLRNALAYAYAVERSELSRAHSALLTGAKLADRTVAGGRILSAFTPLKAKDSAKIISQDTETTKYSATKPETQNSDSASNDAVAAPTTAAKAPPQSLRKTG